MSFLIMGKEVLKKEAEAILHVMETLGNDFDRAIETHRGMHGKGCSARHG